MPRPSRMNDWYIRPEGADDDFKYVPRGSHRNILMRLFGTRDSLLPRGHEEMRASIASSLADKFAYDEGADVPITVFGGLRRDGVRDNFYGRYLFDRLFDRDRIEAYPDRMFENAPELGGVPPTMGEFSSALYDILPHEVGHYLTREDNKAFTDEERHAARSFDYLPNLPTNPESFLNMGRDETIARGYEHWHTATNNGEWADDNGRVDMGDDPARWARARLRERFPDVHITESMEQRLINTVNAWNDDLKWLDQYVEEGNFQEFDDEKYRAQKVRTLMRSLRRMGGGELGDVFSGGEQ